MLTGKHLIAGKWIKKSAMFPSAPIEGPHHMFSNGDADDIDQAVTAAEDAFTTFGWSTREERANLLREIATQIDERGSDITEIGTAETGLPAVRLEGERGRTVGQLRLFADHIEKGDYLDIRHDEALPDRTPLPRPDLRMIQRPIGPVAVFGASNFPLAFSVAGGDTAAALAAGCPVVVKGHFAHPGTSEVVAQAIDVALQKTNMDPGIFSLVQGDTREVGASLVQHPLIRAVGFTGSLAGGRALFDLCARREEPIPFFGELGSVNPVFILPSAAASRAAEIAVQWANSLTMGAGQFCTNPGVVVVQEGSHFDEFMASAKTALEVSPQQSMLTTGIADAYQAGSARVGGESGVETLIACRSAERGATPALYSVSAADWVSNPTLQHEVFGPLGIVVKAKDVSEMQLIASKIEGQLTCTVQYDDADMADFSKLLPLLERKAGRILANGFPTGVEVSDAMVHGGPYPASTNFGATSVGTLSIRRFLRPVCYQNIPHDLMPE